MVMAEVVSDGQVDDAIVLVKIGDDDSDTNSDGNMCLFGGEDRLRAVEEKGATTKHWATWNNAIDRKKMFGIIRCIFFTWKAAGRDWDSQAVGSIHRFVRIFNSVTLLQFRRMRIGSWSISKCEPQVAASDVINRLPPCQSSW